MNEKRKFSRRPLHQVVSFSLAEGKKTKIWYIGKIQNVSIAGMKISIHQVEDIRPGDRVHVLCMPGDEQNHEPIRVEGEVIWKSREKMEFGLRYC